MLEAESGQRALEVWDQADRPIDLLVTRHGDARRHHGRRTGGTTPQPMPRLRVIHTSSYSPGMAGKDAPLLEWRNLLPKTYSIGKLAQFVRE